MHALYDFLCNELEQLDRKAQGGQDLSLAEVEYGDKLAHFKKTLKVLEEMDDGYSSRGGSYDGWDHEMGGSYARGGDHGGRSRGGNQYGSYDRGSSYARYNRRDSMGRYSRDSKAMVEGLRDLMEDAPDERTKQEFRRFIEKMEKM